MPPQTSLRLGKTYTTKTVTVSDGTAQKAVTVSRPGQTSISTTAKTSSSARTPFWLNLQVAAKNAQQNSRCAGGTISLGTKRAATSSSAQMAAQNIATVGLEELKQQAGDGALSLPASSAATAAVRGAKATLVSVTWDDGSNNDGTATTATLVADSEVAIAKVAQVQGETAELEDSKDDLEAAARKASRKGQAAAATSMGRQVSAVSAQIAESEHKLEGVRAWSKGGLAWATPSAASAPRAATTITPADESTVVKAGAAVAVPAVAVAVPAVAVAVPAVAVAVPAAVDPALAKAVEELQASNKSLRDDLNASQARLKQENERLQKELNTSRAELNASRAELERSMAELNASRFELNTTKGELAASKSELNSSKAEWLNTSAFANATAIAAQSPLRPPSESAAIQAAAEAAAAEVATLAAVEADALRDQVAELQRKLAMANTPIKKSSPFASSTPSGTPLSNKVTSPSASASSSSASSSSSPLISATSTFRASRSSAAASKATTRSSGSGGSGSGKRQASTPTSKLGPSSAKAKPATASKVQPKPKPKSTVPKKLIKVPARVAQERAAQLAKEQSPAARVAAARAAAKVEAKAKRKATPTATRFANSKKSGGAAGKPKPAVAPKTSNVANGPSTRARIDRFERSSTGPGHTVVAYIKGREGSIKSSGSAGSSRSSSSSPRRPKAQKPAKSTDSSRSRGSTSSSAGLGATAGGNMSRTMSDGATPKGWEDMKTFFPKPASPARASQPSPQRPPSATGGKLTPRSLRRKMLAGQGKATKL